jgi:hypothetical protein
LLLRYVTVATVFCSPHQALQHFAPMHGSLCHVAVAETAGLLPVLAAQYQRSTNQPTSVNQPTNKPTNPATLQCSTPTQLNVAPCGTPQDMRTDFMHQALRALRSPPAMPHPCANTHNQSLCMRAASIPLPGSRCEAVHHTNVFAGAAAPLAGLRTGSGSAPDSSNPPTTIVHLLC